jgi:hypothetical protein
MHSKGSSCGKVDLFRKYGDRYDMHWLRMAAQGYQESQLSQDAQPGWRHRRNASDARDWNERRVGHISKENRTSMLE